MILYFTNSGKQRKNLIESDYAEDIYDSVIGFFENHKYFPHILRLETDSEIRICFESTTEYFFVEEANEDDIEELKELVGGYPENR